MQEAIEVGHQTFVSDGAPSGDPQATLLDARGVMYLKIPT
jgi:hypothetical protein